MSTTSAETVETAPHTLLNINMTNVTKLSATNYMMWSLQVHALLEGYDLGDHLDGSVPPPAAIVTIDGVQSVNPAHTLWKRQDRLVYSGLIGSITPTVQPLVSTSKTAADIWKTLADTYAKPSRGHIQQLRLQIKNWSKGTRSIDEYIQGFTTRFDQLALLGKPIEHDDQIEYILGGLPEEYKSTVDQLEGRNIAPSVIEIHEKLLNREAKLLTVSTLPAILPITANTATAPYSGRPQQSQSQHNRQSQNWNKNSSPRYQNQRDNRSVAGRGYQGKCQLCGTYGHSARRCNQLVTYKPSNNNNYEGSSYPPWQPKANIAMGSQHEDSHWIMDSGTTHHLTSDLHNLNLHKPYNGDDAVVIGDGTGLKISHTGSLSLPSLSRPLHLTNVLCVPNIHKNLISIYRLCNANKVSVEFFPAHFQVKDLTSGVPLLQGQAKGDLYEWHASPKTLSSFFVASAPQTTLEDWHFLLGHPSASILKTVVSQFSLPHSKTSSHSTLCPACPINKTHKLPFSTHNVVSSRPLQYIFTDVWTSPQISVDNYKYYVILIDHFTRYTWYYPLKTKSQVKEIFQPFKNLVENQFQTKIGTLYSDNGGEFIAFKGLLSTAGISHMTSPPHTPEHNGISERKHRHIVETCLTLLTHAGIPKTYWTYEFATAVYLINRLPSPVISMFSPYQKLFGVAPNYKKLRTFGCLCFPWLRPYNNNKLENRSTPCVLLGYSLSQSAYLCLQPTSGRIYVSRHVQFDEQAFPFRKSPLQPTATETLPNQTTSTAPLCHSSDRLRRRCSRDNRRQLRRQLCCRKISIKTQVCLLRQSLCLEYRKLLRNPTRPKPETTQPLQTSAQTQPPQAHFEPAQTQPTTISTSVFPTETLPAISSSSQPATQNPEPTNHHPMTTRRKNNILKPNTKLNLSAALSTHIPPEPRTVNQALKDKIWRGSMSEELDAFAKNQTMELVPRPQHQNVVGCRWLYKNKFFSNGTFRRPKSRLVAKGYTQQYGRDYTSTFSPVIKSTMIRIVLDTAVSRVWPILQLDVNNAFLQGTLAEEVYMEQPPGFLDPDHPDYVCRLRKAIYGLKQAPHAWYVELKTFLLTLGFKNSLADESLFIMHKDNKQTVYLLVYVDDILVTGSSKDLINTILVKLADRFSVKDPEDLNYFLGIEAHRTNRGLHLSQRKYILDLLHKYNMIDAKPVATPMAASPKLTLNGGHSLSDPTPYRQLIGSLQYLQFTRLDIAFAVNRLSQFMHHPTEEHWQAAKRILRYLAGTTTHGVYFAADNKPLLHGFSDADWAGDTDDYISTNAYIIYSGKTPVSWSSKKQTGVARSSTEAEYRSIANAAAEIRWICNLLTELGIRLSSPPTILCDNLGATFLCANPVFHSRTKHVALDYHFIRGQIQRNMLRVSHVNTKDQLADALTKPLLRGRFVELRNKIGVSAASPS